MTSTDKYNKIYTTFINIPKHSRADKSDLSILFNFTAIHGIPLKFYSSFWVLVKSLLTKPQHVNTFPTLVIVKINSLWPESQTHNRNFHF